MGEDHLPVWVHSLPVSQGRLDHTMLASWCPPSSHLSRTARRRSWCPCSSIWTLQPPALHTGHHYCRWWDCRGLQTLQTPSRRLRGGRPRTDAWRGTGTLSDSQDRTGSPAPGVTSWCYSPQTAGLAHSSGQHLHRQSSQCRADNILVKASVGRETAVVGNYCNTRYYLSQ